MTLAGCGIKDNSTIRLLSIEEPLGAGMMQLHVLDINGKTNTVEVESTEKVMRIMAQVHGNTGIRHIYQRIIYGQ